MNRCHYWRIGAAIGATASGMIGAIADIVAGDRISDHRRRLASGLLLGAFCAAMLTGLT